jgi:hypothetical protein
MDVGDAGFREERDLNRSLLTWPKARLDPFAKGNIPDAAELAGVLA